MNKTIKEWDGESKPTRKLVVKKESKEISSCCGVETVYTFNDDTKRWQAFCPKCNRWLGKCRDKCQHKWKSLGIIRGYPAEEYVCTKCNKTYTEEWW